MAQYKKYTIVYETGNKQDTITTDKILFASGDAGNTLYAFDVGEDATVYGILPDNIVVIYEKVWANTPSQCDFNVIYSRRAITAKAIKRLCNKANKED